MRKPAFLTLASLLMLGLACSESEDTKETVVYGTLKTTSVAQAEPQSLNLSQASCSSDAESGFFKASLRGEGNATLEVRIKGFSTSKTLYTCTQASDNADGDVGQKFDECSVEFSVPDVKSGLNTFAMHRSSESIKDFTYSGSCMIKSEYQAPNVKVSISCADLIQTHYQSAARNPIDPAVTGSAVDGTSFSCKI